MKKKFGNKVEEEAAREIGVRKVCCRNQIRKQLNAIKLKGGIFLEVLEKYLKSDYWWKSEIN